MITKSTIAIAGEDPFNGARAVGVETRRRLADVGHGARRRLADIGDRTLRRIADVCDGALRLEVHHEGDHALARESAGGVGGLLLLGGEVALGVEAKDVSIIFVNLEIELRQPWSIGFAISLVTHIQT